MPAPEVVTHAIALGSEPRGDAYIAHRLLSSERGNIIALVRRSTKPGKQPLIDLFDEGEFRIEMKPSSVSGFIKDAQIARKRLDIAKHFPSFEAAARLAKIINANPAHDENLEGIFDLLTKGLDAWETSRKPQATFLKCLYLYCRQEGYPVKEQWANQLPADEARVVAHVLNSPLPDVEENDPMLKRGIDSLEQFIRHHTHIRLSY